MGASDDLRARHCSSSTPVGLVPLTGGRRRRDEGPTVPDLAIEKVSAPLRASDPPLPAAVEDEAPSRRAVPDGLAIQGVSGLDVRPLAGRVRAALETVLDNEG